MKKENTGKKRSVKVDFAKVENLEIILKLGVDKSVVEVYEQIKEALDTLMKKYTSETCDFHF